MAICEGEEPRAEMLQMLADCMCIATVARDAVGGLRQDLIDIATLNTVKHRVEPRALHFTDARTPADFFVGECVDDGPSFAISALAQRSDLIDSGQGILQFAGISGVEDRAHRLFYVFAVRCSGGFAAGARCEHGQLSALAGIGAIKLTACHAVAKA